MVCVGGVSITPQHARDEQGALSGISEKGHKGKGKLRTRLHILRDRHALETAGRHGP